MSVALITVVWFMIDNGFFANRSPFKSTGRLRMAKQSLTEDFKEFLTLLNDRSRQVSFPDNSSDSGRSLYERSVLK
jgi:hypothetical protein